MFFTLMGGLFPIWSIMTLCILMQQPMQMSLAFACFIGHLHLRIREHHWKCNLHSPKEIILPVWKICIKRHPLEWILGPMKGVLPTPDTGPFFPSDTDIQTKINFSRHRHSESSARHSTPYFSPTLDTLISKSTVDITQYFESTLDTHTPFHGP